MSDIALRFGAKDDGLTAQFRKVNQQLDQFKTGAERVANSIGSVFRAVAPLAAAAAVAGLAHEALQFADAAKKMQDQTGFSNDTVQRLAFIAGQAGVEVGTLTSGTLKLQKVLGGFEEGADKAANRLERLGLATEQFRHLAPEQQFTEVAKAIAGISDQNARVVATTDLFGKSGGELLPVLIAIGNEAEKLEAKFDSIGGAVGKGVIDTVDELGDNLQTTGLAAKSLATELLGLVAPPLIAGLEQLQHILGGLRVFAGGGGNEDVNLDRQIDQLERQMANQLALAGRAGAQADAVRKAITDNFNSQINELKRLQNVRSGLGIEGIAPKNPFPNLAAPGEAQFEESDAERKDREQLEAVQHQQRLSNLADFQLKEHDLVFKHNQDLLKINDDRLLAEANAQFDIERRKLRFMTDGQEFLAGVRRVFGLQEIKLEEIKNQSILQIAGNLFNQLAAQNTKLAKLQQGIALAQTIWSTAAGIMKAFEELPWPANLAAAAKVAITGAIQVAKIKSTNYNAGSVSGTAPTMAAGGAGVGSSGSDSQSVAVSAIEEAQGATNVYITGMITPDIIDQLVEGLRDGFDRDVVIIPVNSTQAQVIRGAV